MLSKRLFIFLGLFASAVGLFLVAGWTQRSTAAGNQRVITIHDRGGQQTIATDAATVGEALKRADVDLTEHDAVEPAADVELTAAAYTVNVYRARPVTIVDGTTRTKVMSPHQSPRSAVADAGIELYPEDEVEAERIDDFMAEQDLGVKITVNRATLVTLVLYGTQTQVRTNAATVGALLQEKRIVLGQEDGTSLPADTRLAAGMIVDVWRNGVQTKTEEQPVAFEKEIIQDADKDFSFREIREPGKDGKKMVTFEITLKNGQEVGRKEIQSVVTEQPTKQVEVVGTKRENLDADFAAALARLRQCEAGGVYDRNSGNGYYGAYQYNLSTWANFQGYARPDQAPPAVQDAKAAETYQRRGWQPWPACSRKLGLQDAYR